ncbi:hypothetical protein NC652_005515 [Populus alba x Populus x berolinensis]|nr:hypothetical protein NC652_005515 [Populus alba x Populus x berolinensis]
MLQESMHLNTSHALLHLGLACFQGFSFSPKYTIQHLIDCKSKTLHLAKGNASASQSTNTQAHSYAIIGMLL